VPDASHEFAWLVITLSLIAVIYVGLVALVQDDMKKLVAYSSIAHMGFVTLGTFIAFTLVREYGSTDAARLGLQPKPLTDLMEPSIAKLATQIAASKL